MDPYLSSEQIKDAAQALSDLDIALIHLRQTLCIAQPMTGWVPTTRVVLHVETVAPLLEAQRAVCHIAESLGIDPKQLTDDVHNGRG